MTHLSPVMLDALKAAMPPQRLSSAERDVLQRKIESLITTLHPDGYEAAEILDALTHAVKSRYSNQLVTEARIDQYAGDLTKTFERAYDAAE